jgi:hypothetical protein
MLISPLALRLEIDLPALSFETRSPSVFSIEGNGVTAVTVSHYPFPITLFGLSFIHSRVQTHQLHH